MPSGFLRPRHNYTGPDAVSTEILFDQVRRSVDPSAARPGTVLQWQFPDHEPWHLVVDNGDTRVARGRAPAPDLVIRTSFEDWVDVTSGRADPAKLLLRRRLRPKGKLRLVARLSKIFA